MTLVAGALTEGNAETILYGVGDGGRASRTGCSSRREGGTLFINGLEDLLAGGAAPAARRARDGQFQRTGGHGARAVRRAHRLHRRSRGSRRAAPEPFRIDLLVAPQRAALRIPPLRDYAEDVPELLRYYVDRLVDEERLPFRRFSVAAQNRLRNYPWPGNIRELKNLVHRLLIQGGAGGDPARGDRARDRAQTPADEPLVKQDLLALPLREAREHFERAYLTQQLQLCSGKVGQLAKRVGMERTHLYRKLRSLGVDFRQSEE